MLRFTCRLSRTNERLLNSGMAIFALLVILAVALIVQASTPGWTRYRTELTVAYRGTPPVIALPAPAGCRSIVSRARWSASNRRERTRGHPATARSRRSAHESG
jgi:hypothetical protein